MTSKDIAIKVENLGKRYRIGLKEDMHDSLGSSIVNFIKTPLKNYRKYRSLYRFDDQGPNPDNSQDDNSSDIIWALRDVSFEVKKGEAIGIIGRNGAGKSTLLKILSRITAPTNGQVEIRGKISCLLEVGTGFHPELTGRDNVYLNGTVLGMRKIEVDHKFDEIVDFSGIEKFIDTPVKRYSSGMKVRLAFSVAAHLEPEILIVDEVLAVGDAEFQKKCLNKMEDVGREGRTVLFVSHNMSAISRLCDRGIILNKGGVVEDGPADQVVATYLTSEFGISGTQEWIADEEAPGGNLARLVAVRVRTEGEEMTDKVNIQNSVMVEMEYEVLQSGWILLPNFHFYNSQGIEAFPAVDVDPQWRRKPRPAGRYISSVEIPGNFLAEGMYVVRAALITSHPLIVQFNVPSAVAFTVNDTSDGNGSRGDYTGNLSGTVRPLLNWNTRYFEAIQEPST